MAKLAGILLTTGSILFIIAVSTPVISNVVGAFDNPQLQVEYIKNDLTGWTVAHLLMGAGSLIAAIGLLLFARQVQSITHKKYVRMASYLAGAMAIVGALVWVIISYNRIVLSPEELVHNLNITGWMFPIYSILTQIALVFIGFVLLQSGYPKWVGWVILVVGGLTLVAYLVLGDMPPLVYYPVFLIMGIMLLRSRSSRQVPQAILKT
jgi:hypothetical protein